MKNLPCLLSVTKNVLEYRHTQIPDEFIYLYFTNLNLKFDISYPEHYHIPNFDIIMSNVSTNELKNHIGVEFTEFISDTNEQRWKDVIEAVECNENIMIKGINSNLPKNNNVFITNVPTYMSIHNFHRDEQEAVISTHRFTEKIDLDILKKYVSEGEKQGAEANWWGKVYINTLPVFSSSYLLNLLCLKIDEEERFNPTLSMLHLKEGFERLCSVENKILKNIALKNLSEQFIHPYGPVASRNRLSFILSILKEEQLIDIEIYKKYQKIYDEWEILSLMLVKYTLKNNENLLLRILDKMHSLSKEEEEGFNMLLTLKHQEIKI